MVSSSYHESLWEHVPEASNPPDLSLRRSFLLEHAGRVSAGTTRQDVDAGDRRTRVLDVGCGEARLTAELVRTGFAAVGVDVAEEPLRRARRAHPDLDLRVVPVTGVWPLQDASFDVVWAGETIEHIADTAAWLSELRRVLRSGGSLLLSTPDHGRVAMLALALSGRRFDAHFNPRADHLRFYTRRTLSHLLADFGFEDIEVRAAGGIPGARRVLLASAARSRF
jgi:2-polyprenyl-6-hydroxyphenyl methylase/3-demethylubiquinone-9 3-methyltransferase